MERSFTRKIPKHKVVYAMKIHDVFADG